MLTLLVQAKREVSLWGSILVVVALMAPFYLAYLVSVYENRLLYFFSGGREVLPKGALIGSVLSTVMYPLLGMSFGLFGVAHLAELFMEEEALASGQTPGWAYALYALCTLIFALVMIVWSRRRSCRKRFTDNPEVQESYTRWVVWLNVIAQIVLLGFFWALIGFFPELSSKWIS